MKRLFILMLLLLASSALKAQISRETITEDDGFVWILVIKEGEEDDFCGAEDKNGKTIISLRKKYVDIDYDDGFFIVEDLDGYEGVIDKKGKVLIPTNRHYKNILFDKEDNQFQVYKDKVEYICDIHGKELGKYKYATGHSQYATAYNAAKKTPKTTGTIATTTATPSTGSATTAGNRPIVRSKQTDSNGFVWYQTRYEGDYSVYGAEDADGRTLIPLSKGYSSVFYYNGSFGVEKNKAFGAYDKYGSEVISTDRGYDRIVRHDNYYSVFKNGKEGACDLSGKEVVSPAYNSLIYLDGVYKYQDSYGNWQPVSGSPSGSYTTSSSSTYSGSSSSSSYSGNGGLLYSGVYTVTGVFANEAGITSSGFTYLVNLTIYEKSLTVEMNGSNPDTRYYIGTKSAYGISGRAYGTQNDYYLVTDTGRVTHVISDTSYIPYLGNFTQTSMFYLDNGDTRAAYISNSTGGGSGSYGGSSSHGGSSGHSNRGQQSCKICHGTGLCQTCNGSGWVTNPYTSKDSPCSTCNDKYGTGPNRGKCWSCHGTGKKQ